MLKLLQETYLHKIDIIYIDPPYNTGNNLIYKNDFSQSKQSFMEVNYDCDEDGNKIERNVYTDGRFHTNWLNMIYQRILIAKNLLAENGVLVCTIDQSEVNTLGLLLKQVFSGKAVSLISIVHNPSGTQGNNFAFNNEFAFFVYDDSVRSIALENRSKDKADIRSFMNGAKGDTENYLRGSGAKTFYPIIVKDDHIVGFGDVSLEDYHPQSQNVIQADGTVHVYPIDGDGIERKWLFERGTVETIKDELHVKRIKDVYEIYRIKNEINYKTVWTDNKYNAKTYGSILVKELVGSVFSNPKSLYAVEECIKAIVHDKYNATIMDFFSGSSTTAHAVMDLNATDGGKRKFIMVQLPENLDDNLKKVNPNERRTILNAISFCDELNKPHNIAEVAKERIRRSSKKIANDNPGAEFDGGFRVLKCDSSNMKDVYYKPEEYQQTLISEFEENIKEDRTPEDLLFQVMIDLGILLSSKIEEIEIEGKKVFNVADGFLMACFDKDVTDEAVKAIAENKPVYVVFRDNSMASDSVATNFDQIFEAISPDTVRKVI